MKPEWARMDRATLGLFGPDGPCGHFSALHVSAHASRRARPSKGWSAQLDKKKILSQGLQPRHKNSLGGAPAPERHLGDVGAGASATIERISPAYATFLEAQGVAEGLEVQVLGTGSDGSVLVEGPSGPVHLTSTVARAIAIAT